MAVKQQKSLTHKTRAEPGTTGEGRYFRIIVHPKERFTTFRNQDVGKPGGLQRLAGRRKGGSWDTHAWLVSKKDAHREGNTLVADSKDAKDLLRTLDNPPTHEKGDIYSTLDNKS